jgi:hypothetical protein
MNSKAVEYLTNAPLPVVMAFVLLLGSWVYVVADDVKEVEKRQAVLVEKADDTKEDTEEIKEETKETGKKLDKLLELMLEQRAEQRVLKAKVEEIEDKVKE